MMEFRFYLYLYLLKCICAMTFLGPQPKIIMQNGHVIIEAVKGGNISFNSGDTGKVHVNGIDLSKTIGFFNGITRTLSKYEMSFDSILEKISKIDKTFNKELLVELDKIKTTNISVPRIWKKINSLNTKISTVEKTIQVIIDLLHTDECVSAPCKNGGTCIDLFNEFLCQCPQQWEGRLCDRDVNECARFAGTDLGCQNGATCVNKNGTYECLCLDGWFGIHCTRHSTDCRSGSSVELCGHGTCIPYNNKIGYKCLCDQGWTTNGTGVLCNIDVDECENSSACSVSPHVQCINLRGSFTCGACPLGYTGNGFYCTDIDECASFNGGCSTNPRVQCINTLGSRICGNCPPGYSGDGVSCYYQGSCNINNGGCHYLATCHVIPGSGSSVSCTCPSGFTGNGIGPNGCSAVSKPCLSNPCQHDGTCVDLQNTYMCLCGRHYSGRNCDVLVSSCAINSCLNGGTCVNRQNSTFYCHCLPAFTGSRCENELNACGGHFSAETGTIIYPLINSGISYSINCVWTIETNESKVLNISFRNFHLKSSPHCEDDYLQIYDDKSNFAHSLGKYCGSTLPNAILSSGNSIYLRLKSNNEVAATRLEINWTSLDPICGAIVHVSNRGTLASPGSPGSYPSNRDCFWKLLAPENKRIVFHFFSLMLEDSENCNHDYLEFISGTVSSDEVFAKYCNTSSPSALYSPGPEVLVHFHSDASGSNLGFQIVYSLTEGIPGCGGVYTLDKGVIYAPLSIGNLLTEGTCIYKIIVKKELRIKLTFQTFNILKTFHCMINSVSLHNGSNSDAPLIEKFCGASLPPPYFTEGNEILIVYKFKKINTDFNDTFSLSYETVCGGRYTASSGTFESPGYPFLNNSMPLFCIYKIIQPLDTAINVTFLDYNMQLHTSEMPDLLIIRDGDDENSPLIGSYTIYAPKSVLSTHNYLWIRFANIQNYRWGRGFKAIYSTINIGCGGIVKTKNGNLPPRPLHPEDTFCKWIIVAPSLNVIRLSFSRLDIDDSDDCRTNFLEIFDNNTVSDQKQIGKFCGQNRPRDVLSTSNILTVVFRSQSNTRSNMFGAYYTFFSTDEVCYGNYYTRTGILKSPFYPKAPVRLMCFWTINVPPRHKIVLNVTDFDLNDYSSNDECTTTYLSILNGRSLLSSLIGKFCNEAKPHIITSTTNNLMFTLKTSSWVVGRGFVIRWYTIADGCGGVLHSSFGSITSPGFPFVSYKNIECIWKIFVNHGNIIRATFYSLHQGYAENGLKIYDGSDLNSQLLWSYSRFNRNPDIISSSNHLLIQFESGSESVGPIFDLRYSTICSNRLTGYKGIIESPGFPEPSSDNLTCSWNIRVDTGNKINLTFSHFNIHLLSNAVKNKNCSSNYLEIRTYEDSSNSDNLIRSEKFCELDFPASLITLPSSNVELTFVNSLKSSMSLFSFRVEWRLYGCGGILTEPLGAIQSPNYPKPYPEVIECTWEIQAPVGNSIEITFHNVDIAKNFDCRNGYITVKNNRNDTYPSIATFCHQDVNTILTSSEHFMFVKFKSNPSYRGQGFNATYKFQPASCGGEFKAVKGNIMSPSYPNNHTYNDTCGFLIHLHEGSNVYLEFVDYGFNCSLTNKTYIKIFDGPTAAYPVLSKICGDIDQKNKIVSTYNTMYVETIPLGNATSKGFLAKYRKACGSRIVTTGSGNINFRSSEIDPLIHQNCSWIVISANLDQHVSLTISYLRFRKKSSYKSNNYPLKIYNGESLEAPLLGEYGDSKIPPTLTSDGPALRIVLESEIDFFATYSVYDSTCGGDLMAMDGYFSSPGYPNEYPVNFECEWVVNVSKGNKLSLNFIYFGLLASDGCDGDFLEIRSQNSTGKLLGVFCGDVLPSNITNVGSLWIMLKTGNVEQNSKIALKGFYAEYALNRHTELTGPQGSIYSPYYGSGYIIEGVLSWTVTVDFNKVIEITFRELILIDFNLKIMIYDGFDETGVLLESISHGSNIKSVKARGNSIFIKADFGTNENYNVKFVIEWTQVERKSTYDKNTDCGFKEPIDIHGSNNYTNITSPGFPKGFSKNLQCEWVLVTIPMNHIEIYFSTISINNPYDWSSEYCYDSYVQLFKKKDDSWELLVSELCKNTSLTYQAGSYLKIVFSSSLYSNGSGFSAHAREVCGGSIEGEYGFIMYNTSLLSSSKENLLCEWNVTVNPGNTIELKFVEFNIKNKIETNCTFYILLRNGLSHDSPFLGGGKYCDDTPPVLQTTGNHLHVKYSGPYIYGSFKLKYRSISNLCGKEIYLKPFANSTVIQTPNYPNVPPPHIQCVWIIYAPIGETLRIDFNEVFDLNPSENCVNESVEVRDGATVFSNLIGKFCSKKPSSLVTTDHVMFVKYFTQFNEPNTGFEATVTISKCGGTIRGESGVIQSPYFEKPKLYPRRIKCTWFLVGPESHYLEIDFLKLDLELSNTSCTNVDHVKISERLEYRENIFGNYCGKSSPGVIRTSSNRATIHFETGDKNLQLNGFALKFVASAETCGGTIQASEGIIETPEYPIPQNVFRFCQWFIIVPKGRKVALYIIDLDVQETKSKTRFSTLYLYNYKNISLIVNTTRSGETYYSTDNYMWVSFSFKNMRGLKARFSSNEPSVCEGDFSKERGSITNPQKKSFYCSYSRENNSQNTTLALSVGMTFQGSIYKHSTDCSSYIKIIGGNDVLGEICRTSQLIIRSPLPNHSITIAKNPEVELTYTISYETFACGGIIIDEIGTIDSPDFAGKSIQCSWLLELPKAQSVQLRFKKFHLGDDCLRSYLEIYNGNLPTAPKIGRYCRNQIPDIIQSQTNYLWIDYSKSDGDNNGEGFSVQYEPVIHGCGGIFHDETRIIQTPLFPKQYPSNSECSWELIAEEGFHIILNFISRFHIEQSEKCKNDYLEIWDWKNKNWVSLGRKCGREIHSVNSTSNRMKLLFRSNDKINGNGFRAQWKWHCGGTFVADSNKQIIVSPYYPNFYKPDMFCRYIIKSNEKIFTNIEFLKFDLQDGTPDCKYDNVSITLHYSSLRILCGSDLPTNFHIQLETIEILFQTDKYIQKQGFQFSFYQDSCGGTVDKPTVLNLPLFKITATNDMYDWKECLWNITAPEKKIVVLDFKKFNLRYVSGCYWSNLRIYEGLDLNESNLITVLCGNLTEFAPIIKSHGNLLHMQLRGAPTNFLLAFTSKMVFINTFSRKGPEVGCGGKLNLTGVQNLSAPNLENMDCTWTVVAPNDHVIKIQFSSLNLPSSCDLITDKDSCKCGFVEVKDGTSSLSETIEKFCNINTSNFARVIVTSGTSSLIRLYTINTVRNAFSVTFTPIPGPCGPTYLNMTDEVQTLTSPHYPNPYPSNLRCAWMLKTIGDFTTIYIRFIDFDLIEENDQHLTKNSCERDKLEILDEPDNKHLNADTGPNTIIPGTRRTEPEFLSYNSLRGTYQFCGKRRPFDFYSSGVFLVITFKSGNSAKDRGKGFKIEYRGLGDKCGRSNYTSENGHIKIARGCNVSITVPENYTISLHFQQLYAFDSPECNLSGIEVYDGAYSNAKKIMRVCGYSLPNPVFSKTNQLLLRTWDTTSWGYPKYPFEMIYTSSNKGRGCGGSFYAAAGKLSSPLYPLAYRSSTSCEWSINVSIGMRVALQITDFDIQGNCSNNFLKVVTYEKGISSDHIFCTKDVPAVLFSDDSYLFIKYQSSSENTGTGWLASFVGVERNCNIEPLLYTLFFHGTVSD